MRSQPTTRYTRANDVHIEYHATGEGPLDLLLVPDGMIPIEAIAEEPSFDRFARHLGRSEVVVDARSGWGLSGSGRVGRRAVFPLNSPLEARRSWADLAHRERYWENRPCMRSDIADRRGLPVSLVLVAVLGATVLLSSCAAGPNPSVGAGQDPAGFWLGLWHGIIFPITFVISLFTDSVSVYEVANTGNWYDFGFFIGVAIALGGSGGAGVRARRRG